MSGHGSQSSSGGGTSALCLRAGRGGVGRPFRHVVVAASYLASDAACHSIPASSFLLSFSPSRLVACSRSHAKMQRRMRPFLFFFFLFSFFLFLFCSPHLHAHAYIAGGVASEGPVHGMPSSRRQKKKEKKRKEKRKEKEKEKKEERRNMEIQPAAAISALRPISERGGFFYRYRFLFPSSSGPALFHPSSGTHDGWVRIHLPWSTYMATANPPVHLCSAPLGRVGV
jgi:hypothetical protein